MPTIAYVYIDKGYMDIVKLLLTKQLKQIKTQSTLPSNKRPMCIEQDDAINLNENLKTRGPTNNSIATQIPGLRTFQTNHSRNNKLAF